MASTTSGHVDTNVSVAEESGATGFTFAFTDSAGDAITPGSINVKIIDRDGTVLRDIGAVSPATSITVVPTAADNTIGATGDVYRGILVEWTETTDLGSDLPNKVEAWYLVRDLAGVS